MASPATALALPAPSASPPRTAPPVASWWLGHLPEFRADKLAFLQRCVREHGDVVPIRFGPQRVWLLFDPELVGEVFVQQVDAFKKDIGIQRVKVVLGDGLLSTEGPEHARRSRLAQPAFRKQKIDRFAADMVRLTVERAAAWAGADRIDLDQELSRLALSIVAGSLFGAAVDEAAIGAALTELLHLLEERLHAALPLPLWIPTPHNRRFRAALGVLDRAVNDIVRQRRAAGAEGRTDLLSRLMGAETEGDRSLSDRELRDEVMTLVLAGHETTANALAFALHLLSRHPDVASRLAAEADRVLDGRPATAADVPRLELAGQVFSEALRLYPPAWVIGRQATRPVELGGGRLRIGRGEMVITSPWIAHRDPRWWGDEAAAFRPERFARAAPRPRPHAYFPFGIGKRACIGRSFALLEGTLVLATLAQHVQVETLAQPALLPQLTLRPGPLPARVRGR